jgi:hypothetical protein
MTAPVTCPKCGVHYPEGAQVCSCGHNFAFTLSPPARDKQIKIERPFDIGKPLGTRHPVSQVCPQCGSAEYTTVKPQAMIAFASDRVCRSCSTRYTPPTPIWARILFGLIGLGAVGFGAFGFYDVWFRGKQPASATGLLPFIVALLVGFACLYKAATK